MKFAGALVGIIGVAQAAYYQDSVEPHYDAYAAHHDETVHGVHDRIASHYENEEYPHEYVDEHHAVGLPSYEELLWAYSHMAFHPDDHVASNDYHYEHDHYAEYEPHIADHEYMTYGHGEAHDYGHDQDWHTEGAPHETRHYEDPHHH